MIQILKFKEMILKINYQLQIKYFCKQSKHFKGQIGKKKRKQFKSLKNLVLNLNNQKFSFNLLKLIRKITKSQIQE